MKPEELTEHPDFRRLVARRRRFTWTLSVVMLLVAFGFCLASINAPDKLSQPPFDAGVYPLGFYVTQLLLLIAVLFSLVYAWYMNKHLSVLIDEVRRSLES